MTTPKRYEYRGEMLTIKELIEQSPMNVSYEFVRQRLRKGMTTEEAVSTPKMTREQAQVLARKKTPWEKTNNNMYPRKKLILG